MLPDPGCYEERYRMTAAALPRHLAVALMSIGLLFLVVAPWVTGVVIAAALVVLMGTGVAARRMIAFRADQAGITLGAVPGRLMVRRGPAVFIPWADAEKIILYPARPDGQAPEDRVPCIAVQQRQESAAVPGNDQAAGCPVPGAAGTTRRVSGWRLDRERLAAVAAAVAPAVPIVDASPGPGLGVQGPGSRASGPQLGPADQTAPSS
jgi:hypothetical protein